MPFHTEVELRVTGHFAFLSFRLNPNICLGFLISCVTTSKKVEIVAFTFNFIQPNSLQAVPPGTFVSVSSRSTTYLEQILQISSPQKDSPPPPIYSLLITPLACCHWSISKGSNTSDTGKCQVQRSHLFGLAQAPLILPLLALPMASEGLLPFLLSRLHGPLLSPRLCPIFSPISSVYRDAQCFPSPLISSLAAAVFPSTSLSLLPTPQNITH